jgi:hypothetical protein
MKENVKKNDWKEKWTQKSCIALMSSEFPGRSRSIWNHQSRPILWFQDPVQVSLSQGSAWEEAKLIGVMGVVGVAGVPVERPPRLPHPNRDVLEDGEAISSIGGGLGMFLPVSKQWTPTPAAKESD